MQEWRGIEIAIGQAPMGRFNVEVDRSIMFVKAIMRMDHEILVLNNRGAYTPMQPSSST